MSTAELSELEIAEAKAEGVLEVDQDGLGWVPLAWYEARIDEQVELVKESLGIDR